MTKEDFFETYERELKASCAWASDPDKLARYMGNVRDTVAARSSRWICDGSVVQRAFNAIGGKGKVSLKKLRALTADPETDALTSAILPEVEKELLL